MAKVALIRCAEEVTETVATDERTEDGYPVMEEQTRPCGLIVDRVELEGNEEEGEKLVKAIVAGKVKGRPKDIACPAGHTGKVVSE